jgi:hypothetical protein
VNRQLVTQQVTALRGFDRIDVANDVGDGNIGRRQFLHKACVTTDPGNRHRIAVLRKHLAPVSRDRAKRVVVDFGARDDWNALVEQVRKQTDDAALCLTAQAEQDDVMPRQDGVDQLRNPPCPGSRRCRERVFRPTAVC